LLEANDRTDAPQTRYTLDDAGNITKETTTHSGGGESRSATYVYEHGRLASRKVVASDLLPATVTDEGFFYTPLGQEERRTSMTTFEGAPVDERVTESTYDPAGYTDEVTQEQKVEDGPTADPNVDYLYDAAGQVIARTEGTETRVFFYFGTTEQLAEETTPEDDTKVRYLVSSDGQPLAQQTPGEDTTWTWLLHDAQGNVGTHLKDDGTVTAQKAYDPYGDKDEAGTEEPTEPVEEGGESESDLGYQEAPEDDVTNSILLGPRIYDPTTERFTSPDFFVGGGANLGLGTDPLTGNRYLFAGANPVAFFDDGHEPLCGKDNFGSCEFSPNRGYETESQKFRNPRPRYERRSGTSNPTGCILGVNPDGSCRGTGLLTRVGHSARFLGNVPRAAPVTLWASLNRGTCDFEYGLTVVCYEVRHWANGPAEALALGAVITELTEEEFKRRRGLLQHETVHTTQSALRPLTYELKYLMWAVYSKITTGDPACGHPMEREAGLEQGGYDHCP
jgi:RHS repeat-associated protein